MGPRIGNGGGLNAVGDMEDVPHRPNVRVTDVPQDDSVALERRNRNPRSTTRDHRPSTIDLRLWTRDPRPSTRDPRLATIDLLMTRKRSNVYATDVQRDVMWRPKKERLPNSIFARKRSSLASKQEFMPRSHARNAPRSHARATIVWRPREGVRLQPERRNTPPERQRNRRSARQECGARVTERPSKLNVHVRGIATKSSPRGGQA